MFSKGKLAFAVSALALSQGAAAFDPNSGSGYSLPDAQEFIVGGATASETALLSVVAGTACSNVDILVNEATVLPAGSDLGDVDFDSQFAVACEAQGITGIANGTQILVRKTGEGGSGSGALAVCEDGNTEPFMSLANCSSVTGTVTLPGGGTAQVRNCGTSIVQLRPEIGITDLEPSKLYAKQTSACDVAAPSFGTPFGVAVTIELRDALQSAQGLPSGSEAAADTPSMSTSLYASLLAGRISTWDKVLVESNGAQVPLTSFNGGPSDGDNRVTICRRADTSGTRASYAVNLLRNQCVNGAPDLPADLAFLDDFPGQVQTLPEASGSSDLARCLTNMNANSTFNGSNNGAGGENGSTWAVGMNSMDKAQCDESTAANGRGGYRYVRLDGALPSYENVANGSYNLWVTSTVNWMTSGANALGGDELDFAEFVRDRGAAPDEIGVSSGVGRTHCDLSSDTYASGIIALGSQAGVTAPFFVNGQFDDNRPVTTYAHDAGQGTDNCLLPYSTSGDDVILE